MKITKLYSAAVVVMAALTFASCSNKKFHINGNITEAKDSMLYLDNISLYKRQLLSPAHCRTDHQPLH